jgi:hypothetical protein
MRFLLGIALGFLACVAVFEAVLRNLPVNSGISMEETSVAEPFARYLPHQPYVFSHGWALSNARRGVTNSLGFTNAPDSAGQDGILVVGDSFIESLLLDFPETLQGRLEQRFPGKIQAISAAGNGLADSLQIATRFVPRLRPSVVVFFVRPAELSYLLVAPERGHNGFVLADGAQSTADVSIRHSLYSESPNKALVLRSSLARYLYYNLKFPAWAAKALTPTLGNAQHAPAGAGDEKYNKGDRAARTLVLNYYFSQLRTLGSANGCRAIFLLDGDRQALYSGNAGPKQGGDSDDRQLFLSLAGQYGFDVADMHPVFKRHWEKVRERMDYLPMDGHWNPVAHKLAAAEVANLLGSSSEAWKPLARLQ